MARMHRFRLIASGVVIDGHRHQRGAVITLPEGSPKIRELAASGRWEHTKYTVADTPPATEPSPAAMTEGSSLYSRLVAHLRQAADYVDGLSEGERQALGEFMVAQAVPFSQLLGRIAAPGRLASRASRELAADALEREAVGADSSPLDEAGESAPDRQADAAGELATAGELAAGALSPTGAPTTLPPEARVEPSSPGGQAAEPGAAGRPAAASMDAVVHDRATPEARELARGVLLAALDKPGQRSKAKFLDLAARAGVIVAPGDAALERGPLIEALRRQLGAPDKAGARKPSPSDLGD